MIGGWSAWMIPVMGLVTTGIGHGGLDPFSRPPEQSKLGFYLRYLGLMAGFLVCWKVFPLLATSIFIFMSAGHFGETEWQRPLRISGNDFRLRVLSWVWGLFASVFSVLFHWEEALPLIQKIAGDLPFNGGSSGPEVARGLGLLLLLLAFGSARILDSYDQRASGRDPSGVLGTLILAIFFSVLPLLAGFFCFFAFWHAWDSIRIQRRRLGLGYLDYAKKAFPLTLIAWGGMGLLFGLSWVLDRGTSFWSVLFVMIGALTTAHAPLMSHFLLREAPGKRRVLNPGA